MLTEGVSLIDSRSDRVVMEPNPTYWNPARRPTVRIVYDNVIGKAEGIRSVAAGDGRVDVVFDLTPDEAKAFPASEHGKIQTKKAKTVLTGVFNENRPDSPWRNPEARRALNLAIDRAFVLQNGAHGYGTVIPAFIQPGRYGADPGLKPMPHDPEGAKRTLDGLGLGGRELVFVASPAWKGVVEAIGQCLAKVGLGCRFVSDRGDLPEKKARGSTLDLGFAYAPRNGRLRVPLGFVDVPGHERLVRTMVTGATGVSCAPLVVAADDGVMPQTREHAAILDLLGFDRGIVAVTKADRADPKRIAAVTAEIHARLAGTGLAAAPVVVCSALTGSGLDDLARLLEAAAGSHAPAGADRGFRLAVDRRFTVTGAGVVVTGAVHAGTVRLGDRLRVSPGAREVRVRGVRVHDAVAETARAGERCALNLAGPRLSLDDVGRGTWVLAPDLHGPATRLDVSVRVLPHEGRPLRHRTPVHLHLGTTAVTGRLLLSGSGSVEPGATAHAVITLDREVSALSGDRFVLRDVSGTRTLGGGRVIDVDGPRRGPWTPERRAVVDALDTTDDGRALHGLLATSGTGVDLASFARLRNLPVATLDALVAEAGAVVAEDGLRLAFQGSRIAALAASVVSELARTHMAQPDNPGLTRDEIASTVEAGERPVLAAALDDLVRTERVLRRGSLLHLPGHTARLRPADAAVYDAVRAVLEEAGLDQPRLTVLADRLGREPDDLRLLLDKVGRLGWLQRISKSCYALPDAVAELARIADVVAREHPDGLLTVGRFRETAGIGRNMTMPLLEFFDEKGFTVRIAEGRRIRTDWRVLAPSNSHAPAPEASGPDPTDMRVPA